MRDELFDVSNKICIVTGGLGQIGKNLAKALYERDARVAVFAAHPTPERVEKIFPSDQYKADRLRVFKVDISKKPTIEAALDELQESWKDAPDVLVNCAGIDTQPSAPPEVSGPFEKFPEEVFREVVDVNLVGTFLMIQAVGARMVEAGKGGSIINIGSIYGMVSPIQDIYAYKEERTGVPFIKPVAYSAAKSGVYNLTRYCATYWGKKGIRVNTLSPAGVWRDTQDDTFIKNFTSRMPMGRMSQEDEYNGAIIFLASNAIGANPVPMPASEMYIAMQNGVVDGQENPIQNVVIDKTYEVQDWYVLDNHTPTVMSYMMNDKFYNSLSDSQKAVIDAANEEATEKSRAVTDKLEASGIDTLEKNGMTVYVPTEEELKGWHDAYGPVCEKYMREQVGDDMVDQLLAQLADIRG